MPQKDTKAKKDLLHNPLVRKIVYRFPHGKEALEAVDVAVEQYEKHKGTVQPLMGKVKAGTRHILDDFRRRQRQNPRETFLIQGLEDRLIGVDETPKVGEFVVMTPEANDIYQYTTEGSYGIVKAINTNGNAVVEFHYVPGFMLVDHLTQTVDMAYLKKAVLEHEVARVTHRPLKVHDKVTIKADSRYAGQHDGEGRIIAVDPFNEELPFIVKFENGQQHNYSAQDLEAVRKAQKPRTEVKYGIKDKKHDETCVHPSLLGKIGHYFGRVTLDHLVGGIVTAALFYVGQCTLENFKEKQSQKMPYAVSLDQTAISNKADLVVGETMLVLGNEKAAAEQQAQMPSEDLMKKVMKIY